MFLYDNKVADKDYGIRVDVTIGDPDDDMVLFTLQSGRLRIPFCLALDKAGLLAEIIRYALEKRESCSRQPATESSETDPE